MRSNGYSGVTKSVQHEFRHLPDVLETTYICTSLRRRRESILNKWFKYMISHKPRGRKLAPIEEVDSDLGVVEASEHMEVDERTARRV